MRLVDVAVTDLDTFNTTRVYPEVDLKLTEG